MLQKEEYKNILCIKKIKICKGGSKMKLEILKIKKNNENIFLIDEEKRKEFKIGYELIMKNELMKHTFILSPESISKYLGLTTLKFNNILKKCGAKKHIWIKYQDKFENINFLIFKNQKNIKKAIEILEPYLIMTELIK